MSTIDILEVQLFYNCSSNGVTYKSMKKYPIRINSHRDFSNEEQKQLSCQSERRKDLNFIRFLMH